MPSVQPALHRHIVDIFEQRRHHHSLVERSPFFEFSDCLEGHAHYYHYYPGLIQMTYRCQQHSLIALREWLKDEVEDALEAVGVLQA